MRRSRSWTSCRRSHRTTLTTLSGHWQSSATLALTSRTPPRWSSWTWHIDVWRVHRWLAGNKMLSRWEGVQNHLRCLCQEVQASMQAIWYARRSLGCIQRTKSCFILCQAVWLQDRSKGLCRQQVRVFCSRAAVWRAKVDQGDLRRLILRHNVCCMQEIHYRLLDPAESRYR